MGRPKGSRNRPKNGNGSGPTVTAHDNVAREPLTDEQRFALTEGWAEEYEKYLKLKQTADADLKNICKKAKSEGVSLQEIKDFIAAGTEEGQKKLQEDAERIERIARWRNFDLGHQFSMFDGEATEAPGADEFN